MKFHEKRFAEEYEARLSGEGYPGILLDSVAAEINMNAKILDVGAGTGFFSIPLARMGHKVTALEPSSEMISILKHKITDDISNNILIEKRSWEDWNGEKYNYIISIHSIYPMRDAESSILKMKNYSDKTIMVIRADEGSLTLTDIVRSHFNKKRPSSGYENLTYQIMNEHKIDFAVKKIFQKRRSTFTDISKEAEYFCYRTGIDESRTKEVIRIIEANAEYNNGEFSFNSEYRDVMLIF